MPLPAINQPALDRLALIIAGKVRRNGIAAVLVAYGIVRVAVPARVGRGGTRRATGGDGRDRRLITARV